MITLYQTGGFSEKDIVPIEATKETESSYWDKKGQLHRKITDYTRVYSTFDEAKAYLVNKYQVKLNVLLGDVIRAEKSLKRAKALQLE